MNLLQDIVTYDDQSRCPNIKLSDGTTVLLEDVDKIYCDSNGKIYHYIKMELKPQSDTLDEAISCECLSINLDDLEETFAKLTDDQRNIVMHVYYMYKNNIKNVMVNSVGEISEQNPKIILQGPAGTGKSTIINFIEKLVTWEENKTCGFPDKIKVLKCAYTGKAASNIGGVTLNTMFSIPIYNTRRINKTRLASKKKLLANCKFFICDEISMVGASLLNAVNKRLQLIFDNDKLYGDRFVLLVGDLYQLDPVNQKRLYPDSKLWKCCEFYELNKIIRQKDEKLIKALNNFRDSKMTKEDISLLRSREIQDLNQVPDSVIHLFNLNKAADEFNFNKIRKTIGPEVIVNAIIDGEDWNPSNLRIKVGIRYMITKNMNVGDGLANGTTGIVRGFDLDKYGCAAVIWMEFDSKSIGRKTKNDYFKKKSKPGFENWVPIHRSNNTVTLKAYPNVRRTVGKMFPLRAAEAITVHKSQGQTFPNGVCIHITSQRNDKLRTDRSLQYVALTRIQRLEDLYIYGTIDFTTSTSKKFTRLEDELKRLRTQRKLKLAYETFEDKIGNVIIFLNTGSTFNERYKFITTDRWYANGSLLIFTETNTLGSDEIIIPNFEITYRSDHKRAFRSGGGIICYKKPSQCVELVKNEINDSNDSCLSLLLYNKCLYIIIGVKGKLNDDDFNSEIKEFIPKCVCQTKCILFIGNFNSGSKSISITDYLQDCKFVKRMSCDVTSDGDCDVMFTRYLDIQQNNIGFYEYIPSSHKAIYVMLPPQFENQNKDYPAEFEKPSSHWQSNLYSLYSKIKMIKK